MTERERIETAMPAQSSIEYVLSEVIPVLHNEEGEHSYFIEYMSIPVLFKKTTICYSMREAYFFCRYLHERQEVHIVRIYDEQRLPLYFDGINLSRKKEDMR